MMRARVVFALAVSLVSPAAVANTVCNATIDEHAYLAGGGKIVRTEVATMDPPPDFFCNRGRCDGVVEFKGIIDQGGNIQNLKIARNSWRFKPTYYANFLKEGLMMWGYAPPRLHDRPICVQKTWRFEFSPPPVARP